jgi:hypothetical protein
MDLTGDEAGGDTVHERDDQDGGDGMSLEQEREDEDGDCGASLERWIQQQDAAREDKASS